MIKKIYFWDGSLNSVWKIPEPEDGVRVYVDGANGYSFNEGQLEFFQANKNQNYYVIANDTQALSFDWLVSHYENIADANLRGRIYLFHRNELRWLPIESFTDKELRYPHNLEKMYRAGAFNEEEELG